MTWKLKTDSSMTEIHILKLQCGIIFCLLAWFSSPEQSSVAGRVSNNLEAVLFLSSWSVRAQTAALMYCFCSTTTLLFPVLCERVSLYWQQRPLIHYSTEAARNGKSDFSCTSHYILHNRIFLWQRVDWKELQHMVTKNETDLFGIKTKHYSRYTACTLNSFFFKADDRHTEDRKQWFITRPQSKCQWNTKGCSRFLDVHLLPLSAELCINKCVLCWILRSNTTKLWIFDNKTRIKSEI